jgi:hypothetical protein
MEQQRWDEKTAKDGNAGGYCHDAVFQPILKNSRSDLSSSTTTATCDSTATAAAPTITPSAVQRKSIQYQQAPMND